MEKRPKEFVQMPEDLFKISEVIPSKNLGWTLDIVHAYTHGPEKPLEFLEKFSQAAERLYHFHISGHSPTLFAKIGKTHVPFAHCEIKDYWKNILPNVLKIYRGFISIEGVLEEIQTNLTHTDAVKDNLKYIKAFLS